MAPGPSKPLAAQKVQLVGRETVQAKEKDTRAPGTPRQGLLLNRSGQWPPSPRRSRSPRQPARCVRRRSPSVSNPRPNPRSPPRVQFADEKGAPLVREAGSEVTLKESGKSQAEKAALKAKVSQDVAQATQRVQPWWMKARMKRRADQLAYRNR